MAEERRRNQEKEERKREAERLQERGGWNVLERDVEQGSDDSMDVDSHEKGSWSKKLIVIHVSIFKIFFLRDRQRSSHSG